MNHMTRNRIPSFAGNSLAVRPEERPGYVAPAEPKSLIIGIGANGLIAWPATDAEDAAGRIPGYMKGTEYKVIVGIPLDHPVQIGTAFVAPQ